jgi:hypothetical protein
MRLNPAAFNAHLDNMGQKFKWSKAFACPNVNPDSGAAIPGCPICFGRGWFWPNTLDATAGVASQKVQQSWAQFGIWEAGDTVLSVPENSPVYNAGQFDRLLAVNTEEQFSLRLSAGEEDRLFGTIIAISRVFWLSLDDTAIIEGAIPAFDAAGNLTWPDGEGPPDGTSICSAARQQPASMPRRTPSRRAAASSRPHP